MSDGKVFSKETKELLVKAGSEVIKEKVPFYIKWFIPSVLRIVVNFIDTKADRFVPDSIDPLINEAILAGFGGNYELASIKAGSALNKVINIPLIEEDAEQVMFVEGVRFLISLIKDWIEKRKVKSN